MSEPKSGQSLPVYKRVLLLLLLAAVALGGAFLGLWISGALASSSEPTAQETQNVPMIFGALALLILGTFASGVGLAAYFIVLGTHCFTFDFSRPVFAAFKPKLYVANILVLLPLVGGLALMLAAFVMPVLHAAGLSEQVALLVSVLGLFLLLQMLLVWLQIWLRSKGDSSPRVFGPAGPRRTNWPPRFSWASPTLPRAASRS